MAVVFGEASAQLGVFGNALRELLGLEPLYHDDRWAERMLEGETERPVVCPWPWAWGMVDGNGQRRRHAGV